MSRTFGTILWDLDGTLAYWNGLSLVPRIVRLYLSLLPPRRSRILALVFATRAYLAILRNPGPASNDALYNRRLSDAWGVEEEQVRELTRRLLASPDLSGIVSSCIRPIPEARTLVVRAAELGWRQVVATNPVMPSAFNRLRLEVAGFPVETFSYISGSDEFVGQKTSVLFYERLLEVIRCRPGECVMVGNDPRKDLVAKRAGIPVYLLDTRHAVKAPYPASLVPDWVGGYEGLGELVEAGSPTPLENPRGGR